MVFHRVIVVLLEHTLVLGGHFIHWLIPSEPAWLSSARTRHSLFARHLSKRIDLETSVLATSSSTRAAMQYDIAPAELQHVVTNPLPPLAVGGGGWGTTSVAGQELPVPPPAPFETESRSESPAAEAAWQPRTTAFVHAAIEEEEI